MKYAQFVMGPAGCGKSTYCHIVQEHFKCALKRTAKVINLDPAAENFVYECDCDVRDLISLEDVMEELDYGPNGGLLYAMEYVMDNKDWLEDALNEYNDDTYVLFDCPGQIELYSHMTVMRDMVDLIQAQDFRLAGVYCIDINFIEDRPKFLGGALAALSAMINLELPHINVLTKCDLVKKEEDEDEEESEIHKFLEADTDAIIRELKSSMTPNYRKLNEAMGQMLDEYSLVSFVALNRESEESIELCLAHVHNCIQYGEDLEPTGKCDGADRETDD